LFGLVREIFLEFGKNFAYENIIEAPRDIFYLTKEEIFNYVRGTSVDIDFKTIIKNRKEEFKNFGTKNPTDSFSTYGIVYKGNNYTSLSTNPLSLGEEAQLSGIGACAGVVRAKVKIVHSVAESEGLEGCIMVAERTDPGWVPLFPISKGILVERGSILSHSAIVAREMGIPAIVGVNNLLSTLKDGDEVEMDGSAGTIRIIKDE
jgi:pyruvate,water dikinase